MPAATATRKSKDQRRTAARDHARELKRLADAEKARRQEEADEAIAPSVQRKPVLDASGDVLRAARVERDGVSFIRANPLVWLEARADKGKSNFRPEHFAAARRLVMTWESVGLGIGPSAVDLSMPRASRSNAPHTPPQHTALLKQVAQEQELRFVRAYINPVWPLWECLFGIVISGKSPTGWATEAHFEPKTASGFLISALSLLSRVYSQLDGEAEHKPRKARIRTWAPGERAGMGDGENA